MNELTGFDRVRYIQLLTDLIRNEMEGRNSLGLREISINEKTIKLLKDKIKAVIEEL